MIRPPMNWSKNMLDAFSESEFSYLMECADAFAVVPRSKIKIVRSARKLKSFAEAGRQYNVLGQTVTNIVSRTMRRTISKIASPCNAAVVLEPFMVSFEREALDRKCRKGLFRDGDGI